MAGTHLPGETVAGVYTKTEIVITSSLDEGESPTALPSSSHLPVLLLLELLPPMSPESTRRCGCCCPSAEPEWALQVPASLPLVKVQGGRVSLVLNLCPDRRKAGKVACRFSAEAVWLPPRLRRGKNSQAWKGGSDAGSPRMVRPGTSVCPRPGPLGFKQQQVQD